MNLCLTCGLPGHLAGACTNVPAGPAGPSEVEYSAFRARFRMPQRTGEELRAIARKQVAELRQLAA